MIEVAGIFISNIPAFPSNNIRLNNFHAYPDLNHPFGLIKMAAFLSKEEKSDKQQTMSVQVPKLIAEYDWSSPNLFPGKIKIAAIWLIVGISLLLIPPVLLLNFNYTILILPGIFVGSAVLLICSQTKRGKNRNHSMSLDSVIPFAC